ncbi:hypothetical protein U6A24_04960 [Aquimarina gracilis]|uniref:Uncharacterized protein n=1 Tax=Aquimarina gracilis TaxID=874422 RepID=A0ABU5ZSM5_9FLAO|nr:hypothetical protein [Aquimarina gracilis]MEB3344796.1 hypothetical protein [Aquimarina gracilis]
MKNIVQLKSLIKYGIFALVFVLATSCEDDDPEFNFAVLPSYQDGIQNLDETGVDCGGGSGVACPTCSDGIQNGNETGIDCGGSDCSECPEATPRFDALQGLGLPYFHSFELAESAVNLVLPAENSVTLDFGIADPAGSDEIVGRYTRPEGNVADGFSDFKFEAFDAPIDFSEYNKFTLDVFMPSSNAYDDNLVPLVEIILLDNTNPAFWETWTVLNATVDPADFDSWFTIGVNGGDALAAATIYNTIAIRIGGSNHQNGAIFYVRNFLPTTSLVLPGTPRADALATSGLPRYFTFEAGDASSGTNLEPRTTNADGSPYGQGVDISYGVADPAGSNAGVARVYRPDDGRFGGFEDFKFQPQTETIDFSEYHKFKVDVFIPSGQDFSGALTPTVELILHDDNPEFFNRWTVISQTVTEFDTWVTLEFDGADAAAAGSGTLLPDNTSYTVFTLRFGGSGHTTAGEFYVKDFVPFK